jgi:hypothetical protein
LQDHCKPSERENKHGNGNQEGSSEKEGTREEGRKKEVADQPNKATHEGGASSAPLSVFELD